MSENAERGLIGPEPMAFHPKPKKKKRHPVHKTIKGRVVYHRKRHFFSTKDVARILKNILEYDQGIPESYLRTADEFYEILEQILELYFRSVGAKWIADWMGYVRQLISFLLGGTPPEIKPKEKLDGSN